ncbi:MAG: DUF488 family protein [Nanoarchaeota archaeon]
MLYTKSILKDKDKSDGVRISVMSRHTLEDGITTHPLINKDSYDEWLKILAPTDFLVGNYYKIGFGWDLFSIEYLEEIREGEKKIEVEKLAMRSLKEDITLLCIEPSPERCHRRLLAEECARYLPQIEVVHR